VRNRKHPDYGFMYALIVASLLAVATPLPAVAQEVHAFDVSASDPATAIKMFGIQAGLQILASADDLNGKKFNPIHGDIPTEKALTKMLIGTGLEHRYVGERAVALVRNDPGTAATAQSPGFGVSNGAGDGTGDSDAGMTAQTQETPAANTSEQNQPPATAPQGPTQKQNLEEVVVTGSRIPTITKDGGAQDVRVYSHEQIEQSGQVTVTDFLNTLPEVSTAVTESGIQTRNGQTTVQLRGLPIGTTLVLLDGLSVETSGRNDAYFDLNTVPAALVDRIEIVPEGSSAVYGSDAIGGIVNVILKKNFDGLFTNFGYSSARDTSTLSADAAWGHNWDRGSIAVGGSYFGRPDALTTDDRSITANENYTAYGGSDYRTTACNPGNVYSVDGSNLNGLASPFAAIPPGIQGRASIGELAGTAGILNKCGPFAGDSLLPETERTAWFATGNYFVTDAIELFADVFYSHYIQYALGSDASFLQQTLPASNPYNPFGENVLVDYSFKGLQQNDYQYTRFWRPVIGVRGRLSDKWRWEVSTWLSRDDDIDETPYAATVQSALTAALNSSNPANTLNLFTSGPPAAPGLLSEIFPNIRVVGTGQKFGSNAIVRGPIANLPSGAINVVFGAEYSRERINEVCIDPNNTGYCDGSTYAFGRTNRAFFSEARIPVVAGPHDGGGETLAVTAAIRSDDSNDFGSHTTRQVGVELRPRSSWLLRATYSQSYRAPPLFALHYPPYTLNIPIIDPLRGNTPETPSVNFGGNPNLLPETGTSRSIGVLWHPESFDPVSVELTYWQIQQTNRIAFQATQVIVDNPSLFPGCIVRGPTENGEPGPIESISCGGIVNFGSLTAAGMDIGAHYAVSSPVGKFAAGVSVTDTARYLAALTPMAPVTDRLGVANTDAWAPRWKGTVMLSWTRGPLSANVGDRYVGKYQDYMPLTNGTTQILGNFWLTDLSLAATFEGERVWTPLGRHLKKTTISLSANNVFNSLPRFSNTGFGIGYDATQYDIVGRVIALRVRAEW
jgi:iron complex outermembrane recepter protein